MLAHTKHIIIFCISPRIPLAKTSNFSVLYVSDIEGPVAAYLAVCSAAELTRAKKKGVSIICGGVFIRGWGRKEFCLKKQSLRTILIWGNYRDREIRIPAFHCCLLVRNVLVIAIWMTTKLEQESTRARDIHY